MVLEMSPLSSSGPDSWAQVLARNQSLGISSELASSLLASLRFSQFLPTLHPFYLSETESSASAEAGHRTAVTLLPLLSAGSPGVSHHLQFRKLLFFFINVRTCLFSCVTAGIQ